MRSKRSCLSGGRDQQREEKDGEGKDGIGASPVALSSSERCPICLNTLSLAVGFPEDCCHAFCISCILKWSETSTSCPVDRKPFQTVYKIDPVGGCTKIHVVTRRQRENCSCNLCQWCCTKGKMSFRMNVIKKSANEIVNGCTKDGCKNEINELELRNQSCDSLCLAGDFMVSSISDSAEINHMNSAKVEEESDLSLIQRKREVLKHLRLPTTMGRIESNSALCVDTLLYTPSFLDDYIFAIRPLSVRNKGFSKRTCVHSCAQEGTEKKQAASGSKGTRKKNVQSSPRRRSTRNSKPDVSQLQNSPKSSNSDNDESGCNRSTTNTVSTEHSNKPPAKQRKRAPKKAPQTRKRLRSATQTQREADESKGDSESDSEQDEKKLKKPDDFPETQIEVTMSPASSTEKINQPVEDHSSPMDQSTKHIPVSSPMQNVESFDKETSASPELQNEDQFDKENSPPSLIFTNGQASLEKSQPESMFGSELDSDVIETTEHLSTEVGHSLQPAHLEASDGACQGSPLSVKCTDVCVHNESASSDSESESVVHEKHTLLSAQSEDTPDCMEQECSDIGQAGVQSSEFSESLNESQSSSISQSKDEHLPELEDQTESSKVEESTSLPAVDPEKQSELEHSPSSCDSFKEQQSETPALPKVLNVEIPVQDSSFISDDGLSDKQVNGVENSLLEPKLTDAKTSVPGESEHSSSTDISVNRTQLPEQSTSEELCDVSEVQDKLCNDDLQNVPLVGSKAEIIPEISSAVAGSKISDNADIGKESDFHNKEQVAYGDNNESVAMGCDSVCSEHESEKTTKLTETVVAEPVSLVSTKTKDLESTEKQTIPLEDTQKKESRPRRSRFHSPSTTWSPTKSEIKERPKSRSRSRSKNRDSPIKQKSRSRSRDKDRNHSEQWKGRSRDRRHRRQSRSKSRSRSRSASRTRNRNRSNTAERSEKDSPSWRERRSNDNWKSPRGSERYRRNEHEKPNEHFRSDKYESRDSSEQYPDIKNDYPDWVSEKIKSFDSRGMGDSWMREDCRGRGWGDNRGRGRGENRGRDHHRGRGDFRGRGDHRGRGDGRGRGGNRGRGSPRGSHWEDNQYNSGDSWNRNVNMDWNSPRGRGGHGRGSFRGGFNYGDQNENSWNNRQPYSGNLNTSGQESTRLQEHKIYKPKFEESFEPPADRSGWTSASSWAVRKTLPADVQNYYSKRGRTTTGSQQGWTRQEVPQDQDQALKDQPTQQPETAQIPVNMVQTQMNVVQQPMNAPPPQPVNIYPYSVGVHPPLVSMQHNPYNIHPPLPIHLHPALPLVQVSAPSSVPQGLPPPPPPPPPSQQVGYVAPQQDVKPLQTNPSVSHVSNNSAAPPLPAPTVAQGGIVGTAVAPSPGSVAASSHSKNPYVSTKPAPWKETVTVEASADSSKKEKKILIQERAAQEVKGAIKQYYQNKDITKDEYKEIVKKAVDKVCHSKSGEVDSAKVANLVKAYVDKYKHSRKKGTDDKF